MHCFQPSAVAVFFGRALSMAIALGAAAVAQPADPWKLLHHEYAGGTLWGASSSRQILSGSAASAYLAVGDHGRILRSTTGLEWHPVDSGTNQTLRSIAWGTVSITNHVTVAVGDGGTILVSDDAGATWHRAVSPTTERLNQVIMGAQRMIAVGENGVILVTLNPRTWTAVPSGTNRWLRGLAASGFTIVATGEGGTALVSTDDGLTWRAADSGTTRDLETVTINDRTILAFGEGGEQRSTPLALTHLRWSAGLPPPPTPARIRASTHHLDGESPLRNEYNGILIADTNGAIFRRDASGPDWSHVGAVPGVSFTHAFYDNTRFILVGSDAAIVTVDPLPARLTNLSTRGTVRSSDAAMVTGFFIGGAMSKRVLLRVAGPALRAFGVDGFLARPELQLMTANGTEIATNRGWSLEPNADAIQASFTIAGAFPFVDGSEDAALVVTLPPGGYSAVVRGRENSSGIALAEIYDLDAPRPSRSRLLNLSVRAWIGAGENVVIPGLVIDGGSARRLLIRAVGPSLRPLGVSDALADPVVAIRVAGSGARRIENDDWEFAPRERQLPGDLRDTAAHAGAFPLLSGSKDAALLTTLSHGAYTIEVADVGGTAGVVLIEVYDVSAL